MKSPLLPICVVAVVSVLWIAQAKSDEPAKAEKPAGDPMLGKKLGQVRDDNGLKMKLVWCPPGFVTMEQVEIVEEPVTTEDEEEAAPETRRVEKITPVKVLLTRGYWLGKYEVTQAEWKQVMKAEQSKDLAGSKAGADYPATFVSWNNAVDFCRKMTKQERQAGRLSNDWEYTLPTEAQWERACRARTETRFSFGDDESKLRDYAWFRNNAWNADEPYAHRVGQKKANPWGLHDMHGNVWEWCRDVYAEKLPGGRDPDVKSEENIKVSSRVFRGGSWGFDAARCRSGERNSGQPGYRYCDRGFRVALSSVQ